MNANLARFGSRVVLLSAGIALTLSATAVLAGSLDARPRWPKDAGVRCVYYDNGYADFFLPGEHKVVPDSLHSGSYYQFVCGQDGNWQLEKIVP